MQLTFLLCLFPVMSLLSAAESPTRCLKNSKVPIPKKHIFYLDHHYSVVVQTSKRPLHRLSTEIFKIYLEEIHGYQNVEIVEHEADFDTMRVTNTLTPDSALVPKAMVDLEVWLPPGYNVPVLENSKLVKDVGDVGPPGRVGWFIPLEFSAPVRKHYQNWDARFGEVHWTFLQDEKAMGLFDMDSQELEIVYRNMKLSANDTEFEATRNIFIPPQCVSSSCALALTSSPTGYSFLVQHILELNLKVKMAFLGSGLLNGFTELQNFYRSRGRDDKGLIIMDYTPSEVIIKQHKFIRVVFPQCDYLNTTRSVGCNYEPYRIAKIAWNKVEQVGLVQHIHNFKYNEEDYNALLNIYSNLTSPGIPELKNAACQWMQNNYKMWTITNVKRVINIGGIFPLHDPSYNGVGILTGADMARNAINSDPSVLKDFTLSLTAENGKCRPDKVMKVFIEYVTNSDYENLLGVLGPACSDTVEPLSGVSRFYKTMVISYSAEASSFSDRGKYPYFYRTIGENMDYRHVYLDLFNKMGWKRVAALTEGGQKYAEYIAHVQEMLEKKDIVFVANTKFSRDRDATSQMPGYLEDLKKRNARIIILDVVDQFARTAMCEAYHLKMTSKEGYIWFLPNWLNETWYDTDYFNKYRGETSKCTTGQMIKAITGYFTLAHAFYAPNDTVIQGNYTVKKWIETYKKMRPKLKLSNYAGYAYDAMWTYALALDKLANNDSEAVSELHSETTMNKLVKYIGETDFMGVSGRIKFRGGPSRFSPITLRQWHNNITHIVGEFQPNVSDDRPEILGGKLTLYEDKLKWFTFDGKRPEDGTPPPPRCTLDSFAKALGVSCEKAIIVLNVVIICLLFVILLSVMVFLKRRYDKKVKYTEKYMRHFGIDLRLNPAQITDLDKWEIPRNSVVINRKLGEGAFGTVYGGETNFPERGWVAVAVKTLKMGSSTEEKLDFLSEAEVMKRFDHKNIIKLLGVCTKEEPIYTIMEFMLYGDLKTFLLARRHLVNDKSVEESDEISCRKLTAMALDVARGLSYLASLKYVHRDVASRNCLINAQRVVKLGDFGMTRPMFENEYYKFTRKGMLPVRWMSPESLTLGVFTPSSDVWSFGVLLYEIITFGSFPYQGRTNAEVLEYVKTGHTITIPAGVKTQLRGLLKSCWQQDPKIRTRASEIVEFLANNPRLLVPCLEVPLASVQLEDSNQLEKVTIPTLNGEVAQGDTSREPLLMTSRSRESLLNFGKYVKMNKNESVEEEEEEVGEYLMHNPGCSQNGYVMSKV